MLPNKIRPFEDETLDSWVYRLAIANGFDNVKSLIKDFFKEPIYHSPDHTFKNLFKLLDAAGITDYSDFILHHTIYSANSLFLGVYRQSIFLDMLAGKNRRQFVLVEKQHNYCPICFEEDGYLKTYHNMPSVCVCPIHKTALLAYPDGKPVKESIDQNDIDYVIYCYKLYRMNPNFDAEIFKKNVSFENGVKFLMEKYPDMAFPKQEKIKLKYDDEYTVLRAQNNLVELIHKSCGTHFCMSAKALNLGFKCPSCRETEEEFYKKMINNTGKYKVIKYEGANLFIEHKECDSTYKTRINSWVNGARCECETNNTAPKLRKSFAKEHPNFEVIDYRYERLYLKHKTCEQVFDVAMRDWKKSKLVVSAMQNLNSMKRLHLRKLAIKALSSLLLIKTIKIL